jgi:hypothetical protein
MKGFRVTVDEVKELLEHGEPTFFVDARTAPDWEKTDNKVKGALRLPASEVEARLSEIPRGGTVITY